MTEQKNLVSKRRFKEFPNTHAWEQRKLGEMSNSFEYGLNASATFFDGINKYIRITDIDDNSRLFNQSALTSPNVDLSNADNYLIKNGDILFARTGASVGKTYRYQESDGKVYYAGFLIRARINQDFDSEFVFQNTLTPKYDNFIKITSQRSGQPGVNAQEYASFDLMVPTLEEQQKIGTFFKALDGTIALHQRKLEKTKALKSAYLSEMFPAEGEREPKRRFAGFTHAWEQRKLGEVADIIGGGTPSTSSQEYWDGDIDWYSPVEIGEQTYVDSSQKKITAIGLQKSSAKILPIGTVLFTSRAGIGNTAILAKEGATNQGFQSIVPHKDELDSYFIYSRTHELKRYGETNGAGSTFVEVSGKQMAKMPMLIPALEEQKKIGGFFERLDHLIAFHQRKLEKLQNIKKAYLNEMFI
ncbi:restriction endonuclease subunit S [Bacillus mycoides]|uniref:restriction endonuclease subunit S n=1 Tax=Bacillus mycoides TaxID=1405 RepID=UPI00103F40AF|nr:restriction endonuclease subunit S [Bacillus mycoides]TBX72057.1 restriction endonuclease subunit S [Bacillus mycoides]